MNRAKSSKKLERAARKLYTIFERHIVKMSPQERAARWKALEQTVERAHAKEKAKASASHARRAKRLGTRVPPSFSPSARIESVKALSS